jgi:SAM-dependent methyltransferase
MNSGTVTDGVGLGWWSDSNTYTRASGLPVIASIRALTATVIKRKLQNGPVKVLSLGIGTGTIYKEFFHEELQNGTLTLYGIDLLESMIEACKSSLVGPNIDLVVADLLELDKLPDGGFDVVEAGLVLHHILRFEDLRQLISKIFCALNPGGSFVLGDIDVSCGEYIEAKLIELERVHGSLFIDSQTGQFVNHHIQVPILDQSDARDLEVIHRLDQKTCTPLLEELRGLEPEMREKLQEIVLLNVQSARKGLEWHRAIDTHHGWRKIVEGASFSTNQIEIISSEEIKKRAPDVLDNPFLLIASK